MLEFVTSILKLIMYIGGIFVYFVVSIPLTIASIAMLAISVPLDSIIFVLSLGNEKFPASKGLISVAENSIQWYKNWARYVSTM